MLLLAFVGDPQRQILARIAAQKRRIERVVVRLQVQGSISLAPGGDVLRGVVDQCAIDVEQEDTGPHAIHCPGMVHSADGHLMEQG